MSATVTREEFEREIETLRKQVTALSKGKVVKKTRKPSAFNIYVGEQIKVLKVKKPAFTHQERFKAAAESWAKAPENPKNNKAPVKA